MLVVLPPSCSDHVPEMSTFCKVRVVVIREQVQFIAEDVHRWKRVAERDIVDVHDLVIAHFNGILELKPPTACSLRRGVRGVSLKRHLFFYHFRE